MQGQDVRDVLVWPHNDHASGVSVGAAHVEDVPRALVIDAEDLLVVLQAELACPVSERDRRARELSLTAKGRRVLSALLPIVRTLQSDILGPLSAADRKSFLELARRAVR